MTLILSCGNMRTIQKHFHSNTYETLRRKMFGRKNRIEFMKGMLNILQFNNLPVRIFLKAMLTKIFIIPLHLMGFKFTVSFFAAEFWFCHKTLRVYGVCTENLWKSNKNTTHKTHTLHILCIYTHTPTPLRIMRNHSRKFSILLYSLGVVNFMAWYFISHQKSTFTLLCCVFYHILYNIPIQYSHMPIREYYKVSLRNTPVYSQSSEPIE